MLLKWIFNLFKVLNSNKNPGEIAAGFSFGLMLVLIPGGNLLWAVLLVLGFFTRLNLMTAFVFLGLGKIIVPLIDPLLDSFGFYILTLNQLRHVFTELYSIPLVPFTAFNNTVVMGGFVSGVILALPMWFLFRSFVILYRQNVRDKLKKTKFVRHITKLPLAGKISGMVKTYRKVTGKG